MQVSGEYELQASRDVVWQKLNDPQVLQQCIPGCESLQAIGDNAFSAVVKAAIGPVKAKFNAGIELQDLVAPERYTIVGNAKSGAAGFGKGSAQIVLHEASDGTRLTYDADLKVGGKLAQIGSRMVVGATRKTADDFFDAFAQIVNGPDTPPGIAAPDALPDNTAAGSTFWRYALIAVAIVIVIVFAAV